MKAARVEAMPERSCLHCGAVMAREMRKDARYCSDRCNSAAHAWTRKARMKILVDGEIKRVSRSYIVERDSSRCHICRKKCRDDEIQIDHVIPLAEGGDHSLENLRVACARCNMSKGKRAVGEQLLLLG